jgi:YidC/Oxa1 family membrane protein insertase
MGVLAGLFGYILNYLYNLVQNYGIAIILFTILLKIVMLPISIKQQRTMTKSQLIQKEVNKAQLKYKNNPEMLNKEVMSIYKREKVSPFSGCLSGILQFIIFISVFYLVSRPLTYMKKVDPAVISKYEQEISESGQSSSYQEIKVIELKSGQDQDVALNMNFLGLDLSKVPMQNWKDWKVFIIPFLYVILTFVNVKITSGNVKKDDDIKRLEDDNQKSKDKDLNKESKKVDNNNESPEEQLDSMKQMTNSMNYMMPIMSVSISLIAPLGLSLYWLVSNILQLGEKCIVDKIIKKEKIKQEEVKDV